MLIRLLCTRVQLRCFFTLKRHLGTKDMMPCNQDLAIAFNPKILGGKKSPGAPFKNPVDMLEKIPLMKISFRKRQ